MAMEFCTLVSGSSGNCTYMGTKHTKILVDVGVSGKKIESGLAELSVQGSEIDGIFITHEHLDHIKGAGVFSRRYNVPIYATFDTWRAMEDTLGKIAPDNRRYVYPEENCILNDLCIQPFSIPHDAAEPVGFSVFGAGRKITVATDLGCVTDTIKEHIADSQILLLEANHDVDMLKNGPYPWHLKQRVLSDVGHLSNMNAGGLLAEVMSGKMEHVLLGHLSAENNEPALAYHTVERVLACSKIQVGKHIHMEMANRNFNGRKIEI
ncbi:MBL fold metallo-hydrolase [Chakrabartyella piscis]|uniref:MBL fold metallo-hydrolase n=1 Tax=Chakrabartyella piscis TaxID=2918914 RepID=UPI002958BF0B|nr:MBL fold metallo-hydrolase [Chakrabartyella piscis]